jgi:hypothetical protein
MSVGGEYEKRGREKGGGIVKGKDRTTKDKRKIEVRRSK